MPYIFFFLLFTVVTADDESDYDVDAGPILLLIKMLDNGWYWICGENVFKLLWVLWWLLPI